MREIVNLGIGSFGVRMTDPLWDKLCAEHLIDSTGKPEENKNNLEIGERKVMFHECENKEQYVPRTAILDLEDIPMSEVMKSKKDLICKSQFVHGKQSGNYYIRAHYTLGRDILDKCLQTIRHQVQKCDNLGYFTIQNCFSGPTGSGFTTLLLSRMNIDYPKKEMIFTSILPSPSSGNGPLECYDNLLGISDVQYQVNNKLMLCLDNQKLYNIAQQKEGIQNPSFEDINKIVATLISKMTLRERFNASNGGINHLIQNLCPYKDYRFITPSLSHPIQNQMFSEYNDNIKQSDLIRQSLSGQTSLNSNPFSHGKYLSMSFLSEGLPGPTFHHKICSEIQNQFTLKHHLKNIYHSQNLKPNFTIKQKLQLFQLSHHTSIKQTLKKIVKQYDQVYAKRAFVHWYVGEGLSEGFFGQARENMRHLIQQYEIFQIDHHEEDEQDE